MDQKFEFGQLYLDPAEKIRPSDAFRTKQPRQTASASELVLKAQRVNDDRRDGYGYFDNKMGSPSRAGSNRRLLIHRSLT